MFTRFAVLTFFILGFFFSMIARAQNQPTGAGYFCIEMSTPTGDFASKNGDQTQYGMAERGLVRALDISFTLNQSFGLSCRLSHMVWNVDVEAVSDYLNRDTVRYTSLVAYPWQCFNVLIGLNKAFPLIPSKRLMIIFKLMSGITYTSASGVESTSPGINNTYYFRQSKSDYSIPLNVGTDLRWDVGRNFSFIVFASYFYTSTHFTDVALHEEFNIRDIEMHLPISAYQLGFGIGIKPSYKGRNDRTVEEENEK